MLGQQTGGWMPRSSQQLQAITGSLRFIIVMGVAIAAAHYVLVKMPRVRELWHLGLTIVKLRPS
jgi:hypothetical protein